MVSSARRLALALAALSLGCAAAPRPVIKEEAPVVVEKIDRGPTSVEAEIGGLNEEAVDAAFASLGVERCLQEGSARSGAFGGAFKLKLRIDLKGGARWAYLSESTLGDRVTEKCMLDLARTKSWPKPLGGEGLAEKSFAIDARAAPVVIEPRRVPGDVARARAAAARCRRGVSGSFHATVYVAPNGHVSTAGVAPPSARGEDASDCVVEALLKVRFSPAGYHQGKVSFEI